MAPASYGSISFLERFLARGTPERHLEGRRIERANRDIHSGDIWGYPGRALACLLSMSLVFQAITGPYLWWRRRRGEGMSRVETATTE
jgi:uncharacterized iron-regulated membrane protein